MSDQTSKEEHEHGLTLHVFTISAGLVGVCLTAIGLLRVVTAHSRVGTIGDELLAADAMLFMVCCCLSFWSFKTAHARRRRRLRTAVDVLFMLALTAMVVVCALIAYAIV